MPSQPPYKFIQVRQTEDKYRLVIVYWDEILEGLSENRMPDDRPGDAIYQLVGTLEPRLDVPPPLHFVPTKETE